MLSVLIKQALGALSWGLAYPATLTKPPTICWSVSSFVATLNLMKSRPWPRPKNVGVELLPCPSKPLAMMTGVMSHYSSAPDDFKPEA